VGKPSGYYFAFLYNIMPGEKSSLGGEFMVSHPRKFLFLLTLLILAALLFTITLPMPASADVGPRPILPGGSNIQPEGQTPIQMASERVTMTVRAATAADNDIIQLNPDAYGMSFQAVLYAYIAEVNASFTMHNPTTRDVSLDTWFPLASTLQSISWELNPDEIVPSIASFQVSVNGDALHVTTSELPNPRGADRPALPWASFPVTFPAAADTQIQVSYLLPLTLSVKSTELALYYVFQSGAGWDGSIGRAELVVNLPYPASQDTIARVLPDHFSVPYSMPGVDAVVPGGAIFEDNQARWIWTDFEPTAQDDFSAWLVNPALYQQMQDGQSAVQASPQDGLAWLRLADTYRIMSVSDYGQPLIFSAAYLAPGLQAYQKAADLLLDDPRPHAGLGLLTLAPYMQAVNAPPEVLQYVNDQWKLAEDLEAQHPGVIYGDTLSSYWVGNALSMYDYYFTATAQVDVTSTAAAIQAQATATQPAPTVTLTTLPSLTPTVQPSASPKPPSSTATATLAKDPGGALAGTQLEVLLPVAALALILLVALYLARKRLAGK